MTKPLPRALTRAEMLEVRDEDIDFSDIPEADESFWREAQFNLPPPKHSVTIRLDADVVAFFKAQGPGYQTRINAVLAEYVRARRDADGRPDAA